MCRPHPKKESDVNCESSKRRPKGINLADNKSVSGQNRLTYMMIDRIKKIYGQAIRNNNGLESMQNAIWAIFHHMIKDETRTLDDQHKFCPQTPLKKIDLILFSKSN